jgi:hypothetical protein
MGFIHKITNFLSPLFCPFNDMREALWYYIRNETDGFAATTFHPHETFLPAYLICNAYGHYRDSLIPKKHRTLIVEIAKVQGGCRFTWEETIPIEVSKNPKILLKGKNLNAPVCFSLNKNGKLSLRLCPKIVM